MKPSACFCWLQSVYRVSVHPSTWYVLRVTARNAAGSTDCFVKFQTTLRDRSAAATLVTPRRVVVKYQPPIYQRVEVVVPACGVVVTIILVAVTVCVYWRRRCEKRAERLAAKVRASCDHRGRVMRWLQLRFDCNSMALRPCDDLRYEYLLLRAVALRP